MTLSHLQYEEIAGILAEEGKLTEAAEMYLKARLPAKAAALITKSTPAPTIPLASQAEQQHGREHGDLGVFTSAVVEVVVEELLKIGLYERAADLLTRMKEWSRALSLHL